MHEEQVRADWERRLRWRTDTDGLWSYLKDRHFVDEVVNGLATVDDLVAEAKSIVKATSREKQRAETVAPTGPNPGEARAWALSMFVAQQARAEEQVVVFRRDVLLGHILDRQAVGGWIRHHLDLSRPMTHDVTLTLQETDFEYEGQGWIRLRQPLDRVRAMQFSLRVLEFTDGTEQWVERIAVADGSELDRLRRLSESLATKYRWQPAQATLFVLTDATPMISRIRLTTLPFSEPWSRRIQLDVDPAESPADVAAAFAHHGDTNESGRPRPVKEKHARAAVHALIDFAHLPWAERVSRWNREHPHWPYTESNFRRDAYDTRERLFRTSRPGGRGSRQQ